MPIYEYQCKACCHCFEELVLSSNDPSPKCPECQCGVRPQGIATGSGGFDAPACKPGG
jgi:putative FmdB family regulatory protein